MKVNLIYYKRNGKFYSDGTYETDETSIHQIWGEVRDMRNLGTLPELAEGHSMFIVSVDIPKHELNHPHLII